MGERDRPDLSPYRAAAELPNGSSRPSRYVLLTQREEKLRRVLRAIPTVALTVLAFVLERPWLLPAAFAWGLGLVILDRLHERSLNARLKALAGTLARDGDPFVAARGLESVISDARRYPGFHSIALLFLGIARARSGDADGALELLNTVERAGWLAHRNLWLAWLLPWLSSLHAARGDLDLAEKWLAIARVRIPEDKHHLLAGGASLVALRRGRPEEAIARIDAYLGASGDAARVAPSEPVRTRFALLRAFACDRAGRPLPADEVRVLVASRVATPGHGLPLENWWPDFAAFVARHDEASAPSSRPRARAGGA